MALACYIACASVAGRAQSLQLVSAPDPVQQPPSGGNGDSWAPVVSADGRYVLFASSANNLALLTNGASIPEQSPSVLNVFLRDRTSGATVLVSANTSGSAGGDGDSLPLAVSSNGQYALFESIASDLVTGDTNNSKDVFVRDILNGITKLASVNTNGTVGNGESRTATMTPDGRYVAFVSLANNLVPDDTNRIADVFVRDLVAETTIMASLGAKSTNASIPMGGSEAPDITPDGRYVAFYSTATNLEPGVLSGGDVYVRDLVGETTIWASTGARAAAQAAYGKPGVVSYNQCISSNGQFVSYQASPSFQVNSSSWNAGLVLRYSVATGLTDIIHTNAAVQNASYEDIRSTDMTPDGRFVAFVANTNGNSGTTTCVMVWDAQNGTITLASGDTNGQVKVNTTCDWPALDVTGRFVTFLSSAPGLVTNPVPGDYHLYQHDLFSGSTTLIDADTNGAGSSVGPETVPATTVDGRLVVFHCQDSNLVAGDRNHDSDVFVRDLASGITELISAHEPGLPSMAPTGNSSISLNSSSGDGRFLAFASKADNLTSGDTNRCRDVFVRDVAFGTNLLVSVGTNGFSGDGISAEPSISPDGRYVAFSSFADNLAVGDTNQTQDVFLRDLDAGTTTLESLNSSGGAGNGSSFSPQISAGGRYLLFRSRARNLAAGSFVGENLFLRDRSLGTNYALTTIAATLAEMTPDGRFVGYVVTNTGGTATVYVWDSQRRARSYTNTTTTSTPVLTIAISPGGKALAFATLSGLSLVDLANGTNTIVDSGGLFYNGLRFNGDGGFLVYTKTVAGNPSQVYLLDVLAKTSLLVSHVPQSPAAANGPSDTADINADGRFVAYRSAASDLVPLASSNSVPKLFIFDRQTGVNSLLALDQSATGLPNNRSLRPVFSGDGRTLYFESWASNLAEKDFNHSSDLFAFTLFYAVLLPATSLDQAPSVSWPYSSTKNYRVQYKDSLGEPNWHESGRSVTNYANRAWLTDPSPSASRRFYRILAF